jgi:hypothetical protein
VTYGSNRNKACVRILFDSTSVNGPDCVARRKLVRSFTSTFRGPGEPIMADDGGKQETEPSIVSPLDRPPAFQPCLLFLLHVPPGPTVEFAFAFNRIVRPRRGPPLCPRCSASILVVSWGFIKVPSPRHRILVPEPFFPHRKWVQLLFGVHSHSFHNVSQ